MGRGVCAGGVCVGGWGKRGEEGRLRGVPLAARAMAGGRLACRGRVQAGAHLRRMCQRAAPVWLASRGPSHCAGPPAVVLGQLCRQRIALSLPVHLRAPDSRCHSRVPESYARPAHLSHCTPA